MTLSLAFDPLLPFWALALLALLAAGSVTVALWRRSRGWWLRGLALVAVLVALAAPVLEREQRTPLGDILLVLIDESASQGLPGRGAQTEAALARLRRVAEAREGLELREVRVGDAAGDGGTRLMGALDGALAEIPEDRLAGVVAVTDGRVHDMEAAPEALPAPFQVLLTGQPDEWDLRLELRRAPPYAILGEETVLEVRIAADGPVPEAVRRQGVRLSVALGAGEARTRAVTVGETVRVPVTLEREGRNLVRLSLEPAAGELTARNNRTVVTINGVRERLRVLLVSGSPTPATRSWRNILKADASVDLVHFTILRPPEKQDATPVNELSLIAFPTRELFLEKIDEFDLIIFDSYELRGILPGLYLDNVRRYVEEGGAVLVAGGVAFAGAGSLARSPFGAVLPGEPTGQVVEAPIVPGLAATGRRHPVTAALPDPEGWGRWMRRIAVSPAADAHVLMTDAEGAPLLMLREAGEGRVALIASDQAWLWDRGFEGGGPLDDLLRRLAHWGMRAPALEAEALEATASGRTITITRRSLSDAPREARITAPDGEVTDLPLRKVAPGRWRQNWQGPAPGLYRIAEGELRTVVALGAAQPREFEKAVAGAGPLRPLARASGGGVTRLAGGPPSFRPVREGRDAAGRGWIGYTPRGAYVTGEIRRMPLAPAWLMLLVAGGLALGAWLREARRG